MSDGMKLTYVEVKANLVFRHWGNNYVAPPGEEFVPFQDKEYIYDPVKGVVVYKLWTRPIKVDHVDAARTE